MSDPKPATDTPPRPSPGLGMQWQMGIYQGALPGKGVSVPVPLELLEKRAAELLAPPSWDYLAGGAGSERTMKANLDALSRYQIVPRMLRDVSRCDLSLELLGRRLPAPLLLGPVGVQEIIHPDGDVASSRAAAARGVPVVRTPL